MKKIIFLISLFLFPSLTFAGKYDAVEAEIFALQKDFISDVAKTLQIDSMSGTRQSGSMVLSTKIDTASASGNITLTLDPYTITVDGKSGNSDMQYRGRLVFDISSSDYRYDKLTKKYKSIPVQVSGYVDFAIALIQAKGDLYMKLTSIDGILSGDEETKEQFAQIMSGAEKYEGKTYKMPNSSSSDFRPEDVYGIVQSGFATLMESPLFTVVSKNKDGSYRLRMDTSTLKNLGINSRSSNKETITYRNTGGKMEIRISPKLLPKMNYIVLSEAEGKRSLTGRAYSRSRYSTSDMNFSISKDHFSLKAKEKNSDFTISWQSGTFSLEYKNVKTKWQDGWTLSIKGPLSPDMTTMNLDIIWKGKSIGNMSSSKSGIILNYQMNLSIVESLWSIIFDMKGNYSEARGDYTILPPKLYELLD